MCAASRPVSDLCRQLADLEHELEQALCHIGSDEKHYALGLLKSRGDLRAARILQQYLEPKAPLGLDEVGVGGGE